MNALNLFFDVTRLLSLALPCTVSGLILILLLKKKWLLSLHSPLDCKRKIHGVRFFGDNKTFLGVINHLTVCVLVCLILNLILNYGGEFFGEIIHPLFYHQPVILGIIFGGGYVIGELINSFVKRRLKINPGEKTKFKLQHFFDLNDGPLVVIAVLCVLQWLSVRDGLFLFVLGWLIHSSTDFLMKKLRLKEN